MAEGAAEVEVAATPEAAWALVGPFDELASWMPGIEGLEMEGDVRVLTVGPMKVRERLLSVDDEAMTTSYSVIEGIPVEHHKATITVTPSGSGSKITWAYECQPDEMIKLFAGTYQGALDAAKAKLE